MNHLKSHMHKRRKKECFVTNLNPGLAADLKLEPGNSQTQRYLWQPQTLFCPSRCSVLLLCPMVPHFVLFFPQHMAQCGWHWTMLTKCLVHSVILSSHQDILTTKPCELPFCCTTNNDRSPKKAIVTNQRQTPAQRHCGQDLGSHNAQEYCSRICMHVKSTFKCIQNPAVQPSWICQMGCC